MVFQSCLPKHLAHCVQLQSNLSDNDRTNLQALLNSVIKKLKYDDDYDFDNEGEEELMFMDYRKQLKILFANIAQVVKLHPHNEYSRYREKPLPLCMCIELGNVMVSALSECVCC